MLEGGVKCTAIFLDETGLASKPAPDRVTILWQEEELDEVWEELDDTDDEEDGYDDAVEDEEDEEDEGYVLTDEEDEMEDMDDGDCASAISGCSACRVMSAATKRVPTIPNCENRCCIGGSGGTCIKPAHCMDASWEHKKLKVVFCDIFTAGQLAGAFRLGKERTLSAAACRFPRIRPLHTSSSPSL
jgi:hypothetical protein